MKAVTIEPNDEVTPSKSARSDRVPLSVWCLAALCPMLRAIPFLITRFQEPPAGRVYFPIAYNQLDFLSYVAFINQTPARSPFLLSNPFTTESQGGRFILLFHTVLGTIHAWTGISPFWLLELSRIPLIFLFMWVLWRFLSQILPDTRTRTVACWLVGLAGGLEFIVYYVAAQFSSLNSNPLVGQALAEMQGWNTFSSFANPLWIAGLILTLCVLQPLFQPAESFTRARQLRLAVFFMVLFLTHPYSAVATLAVYAVYPVLKWILQEPIDLSTIVRFATPLGIAAFLMGLISLWQRQDPVFRICSGGFFGRQALPVFWYPITLGAVGVLALRGLRQWIRDVHPMRFALGAWIAAAILLHTSTVLNGYHYAFQLFIPVYILAAAPLAEQITTQTAGRKGQALMWVIACFASAAFSTMQSIKEVQQRSLTTPDYLGVIERLKNEPAGNVLSPPLLGNMIPAYTTHRVFVGQWFLTPYYDERSEEYSALMKNPSAHAKDLLSLVSSQHIAYLVAPSNAVSALRNVLGERVRDINVVGPYSILFLKEQKLEQ